MAVPACSVSGKSIDESKNVHLQALRPRTFDPNSMKSRRRTIRQDKSAES